MTPEQKLAALRSEAAQMRGKPTDEFTEADVKRASEIAAEVTHLEQIIAHKAAATNAFRSASLSEPVQSSQDNLPDDGAGRTGRSKSGHPAGAIGNVDARTGAFSGHVMDAFKAAAPAVGGPYAQKALVPTGAISARFDGTIVSEVQPETSLLSLIDFVDVDQPKGRYLRETGSVQRANSVPAGTLKPTTDLNLVPVDWSVATLAHIAGPFPTQWFDDVANLTEFVATRLAYGLDRALVDLVLNGGLDEDGNRIDGLLTASGIGSTPYLTNPRKSIRRAIRELKSLGLAPTGIALNPATWEAIENDLDDTHWAQGGTPTEAAPSRLYGVPVVEDVSVPEEQAVVADWATVQIPYRSSMQIAWNPFSGRIPGEEDTDKINPYFAKNLTEMRAELRAGLAIGRLPAIRVVELEAGGEE